MDIRLSGAEPSDDERAAVDALLGPPASGWEGGERVAATDSRSARGGLHTASARRHLLLPALHALQDRAGWISKGGLEYVCRRLIVPPAEAWGVVTFYHLFATEPRPPAVAHVCDDVACRLRGSEALCARLEEALGPPLEHATGGEEHATNGSGPARIGWQRSPCLGQCERAPAVLVQVAGERPRAHTLAPAAGAAEVVAALEGTEPPRVADAGNGPAGDRLAALRASVPQAGDPALRLLRRVGTADPGSLASYREHDGYRALARAIEIGPEAVIAEVLASKLVGRGGAAFPTGRKWQAVAAAPGPVRYLICNADESEPGTFKDRVLLEEDPFALVEAMTVAGLACGCERGYVYLRGEYPLAHTRLGAAIEEARSAGLLGEEVAGSGRRFDLEVRRGAGAYICGEETALFESIEGYRGEPRSKPPFPTQFGLFGKPTLVNNVETLANVPWILLEGGEAFARIGSGISTGPKLFCVSGSVERPGLFEVPFGATLGELLALAGGVQGGRELKTILLGGAAGSFVGPEALAAPLTFEGTRAIGSTLGSGVVLVYDRDADLGEALLRIARFFREESCGQCVPCRVGTVRQEELLVRLRDSRPLGSRADELALYRELAQAMRDASICGLGQTAASAVESALQRFDPFPDGGPP